MQLNYDVTMEPATIGMNFTKRTVMGSEPELSSTITTRVTIFDQALQPIAMAGDRANRHPDLDRFIAKTRSPTAYTKGIRTNN